MYEMGLVWGKRGPRERGRPAKSHFLHQNQRKMHSFHSKTVHFIIFYLIFT